MYSKITAPDGDRNFNELWEPPLPPSKAELRLTQLRQQFGNAAGTQIFRDELPGKKTVWL